MILFVNKKRLKRYIKNLWLANFYGSAKEFGSEMAFLCDYLRICDGAKAPSDWEV